MIKAKKFITVNRGVIDSNRKRRTNHPPIRVSMGRYGKIAYGHRIVIWFNGRPIASFLYRPRKPLPHGARLWVETKAEVTVDGRTFC